MGYKAKLTTKGQITIPKEIREKLGLGFGDEVAFVDVDGKTMIVPRNKPIENLFGRLSGVAKDSPAALDDFDDAIGEGISEHVEGAKKKDKEETA